MRPRLVIILGPTATGKTDAAVSWAEELGGEVISADSMQVYRFLDIGTAKPPRAVRERVPHHLIDIVTPDDQYNAARFVADAEPIIDHLAKAGKPIFVVGGTGLYIRALLGGIFPGPDANRQLRQVLTQHEEDLYDLLLCYDPEAAARIHPRDRVRIIRALEVKLLTGTSITEHQRQHQFRERKYDYLKIGFRYERATLYARINERTHQMFAHGLVDEVAAALKRGYSKDLLPLQTLGYRHAMALLEGVQGWEEAIEQTARDTRHYAKRQETWFRRDGDILWCPPASTAAYDAIKRFFQAL